MLPIEELHPFKEHPFKIRDDKEMQALTRSVQEIGIKVPILVRPRPSPLDGYEIVAGHRRTQSAIDSDLDGILAIIEDMDDETATILMADSNLTQRTFILPSERAKTLKMKYEAIKRHAGRPAKNASQVGTHFLRSDEIIAGETGDSRNQIQRFIRLNELIDPLLDSLDAEEIKFTPAVELSHLKPDEQSELVYVMETEEVSPTLAQAKTLKTLSQQGELSRDKITEILTEEKPIDYKVNLKGNEIRQYFPPDTTPRQMKETIIQLLADWQRDWEQEPER